MNTFWTGRANEVFASSSGACASAATESLRTRTFRKTALTAAVVIALLIESTANAADITVPNGTNLDTLALTTGDTWSLLGNAYLSDGMSATYAKAMPANLALTINGAVTGSVIAFNDGSGHYAYLNGFGATLTLSNVTLTGGNNAIGDGGTLSDAGSVSLNTSGSVAFNGNSSVVLNGRNGGAIYAGSGVTVNGNLVANNNVAANGGGIYARQGVVVSGSLSANSNMAAAGSGGALFTLNNGIAVQGDTSLSGNVAASGNGGAIYSGGGNVALGTTSGNVSLLQNIATGNGGAIRAASGGVVLGNSSSTLEITGNKAGFTATGGTANALANGGAISVDGAVILNGSTISITGNTATNYGGALWTGGSVTVNGSLAVRQNQAVNGPGGAMLLASGDLSAPGDVSFSGNRSAGSGGAINVLSGNVYLGTQVGNVSVTDNASANSGGAISAVNGVPFNQSGTGSVSLGNVNGTVTISGNTAGVAGTFDAPAVLNAFAGGAGVDALQVYMTGSAITVSNNLSAGGGAVSAYQGIVVNGNLVASGNRAIADEAGNSVTGARIYGFGGALQAGGSIAIHGSALLSGNVVTGGGGALSATEVAIDGNVQMNGNVASNDSGGAVLANSLSSSPANVQLATVSGNLSLTNNHSGLDGGAVYAAGIYADGITTVTLGNSASTLTMTGNAAAKDGGAVNAAGIVLNSGGTSSISHNTAGGAGGALWSSNSLTVNVSGGSLIFSDNKAGGQGGAIFLDPTLLALHATGGDITFSGNIQNEAASPRANAIYLANANGDTQVVFDAAAGHAINFYDPLQSGGTQGPVQVTKTGKGMVSFDGSLYDSPLDRTSGVYAQTEVQAGTFEVANSATYGMRASDANTSASEPSTFTADQGSTVQGGGAGTIVADDVTFRGGSILNLAGRQPNVRGVFGIEAANISFAPGSTILFNTELNSGAVQNSDQLLLSGGAVSGTGTILINNIGGAGGITVGDGIRLVATSNGALTSQSSFVLGARVAGGPFEYSLYRGGSNSVNDWFLRDTYMSTPSSKPLPAIRPEVPTDMAVPALSNQLGLEMLGTYRDRQGSYTGSNDQAGASAFRPDSGWGRVFGRSQDVGYGANNAYDRYNRFNTDGPSYSYDTAGFETGFDLYRSNDTDLSTRSGLYIGAGHVSADVSQVYSGERAGTVSMSGYTLGGYWTREGSSGWYVDTVLQAMRLADAHAKSLYGLELDPTGWGLTASVEGGYPFALGNRWSLETQGQFIYQRVAFGDYRDAYSLVKYDSSNALYSRLGARLSYEWKLGSGYPISTWTQLNLWNVSGSTPKTTFAAFTDSESYGFPTSLDNNWAQAQLGVSGQLTHSFNLFASIAYDHVIGVGDGHGLGGRIGARFSW